MSGMTDKVKGAVETVTNRAQQAMGSETEANKAKAQDSSKPATERMSGAGSAVSSEAQDKGSAGAQKAGETKDQAKESASSGMQSAKESASSGMQSAKDTASSGMESAKQSMPGTGSGGNTTGGKTGTSATETNV